MTRANNKYIKSSPRKLIISDEETLFKTEIKPSEFVEYSKDLLKIRQEK